MKDHIELGRRMYTELEASDILEVIEEKASPNYGHNVDGYGSKIPTRYKIKCKDNRMRRVYCICYSNSGSLYIVYKNNPMVMVETAMNEYELNKEQKEQGK